MATWNATDYSQNSSEQQKWARELIAKLNLAGNERVLDLGCGDGKVTAEIAQQLPRGRIVAVDLSAAMIDFAKRTFDGQQPNLSFAQADARSLTFEREFDVVFSNAVLHWIYDHAPILDGIHRALKRGGRMLLQMGGRGNARDCLATMSEIVREKKWSPYFARFNFRYGFHSAEEYTIWLKLAGFTPKRVELIPKDMAYASVDRFAGWFRTTRMPWIDSVLPAQRAEFIDAFIARYLERHPTDSDGRVHVAMVRLEVEATT